MIEKIYKLIGSYGDNCVFLQTFSNLEEHISRITIKSRWKPIEKYNKINLELAPSDTGKKNYKFDFSAFLRPFFIFSDKATNVLNDILIPRGDFYEINTESKRKKFIGYYPTNSYPGILDLDKSKYEKYPNGLIIRKHILKRDKIPDDYLFCIEEDEIEVFVTDKFKKLVEENNLIGFEFSEYNEIELS